MKNNKKDSCNCNDSIKCDVESCKYNNNEKGCCDLKEIKIGCECDNCDCTECKETICESFETKDQNDNLTDNVYEVESESDDNNDDETEEEDD